MADEPPDKTVDQNGAEEHYEEATRLVGDTGFLTGQLIYTGLTLGIFEQFDGEPLAAEEIATDLDLHPENTYRVLRALAHFGVLEEDADQRFKLTAVGGFFQTDHPRSLQASVEFNQNPAVVQAYLQLPALVKDGGPSGFEREFDQGIFEYGEDHPSFGDAVNEYMSSRSRWETDLVLDTLKPYNWAKFDHVCDVGGGHGHLLSHILDVHGHLEGTVLDLPGVVSEKERRWASKVGVADRCGYLGGDMFEAVPAADAYFLKWIIHDWNEEACVELLSNIHGASSSDARVFIIEAIVPGPGESHYAKRLDVDMMVLTGGHERTMAEHTELLHQGGWVKADLWEPTEGPISILEVKKR